MSYDKQRKSSGAPAATEPTPQEAQGRSAKPRGKSYADGAAALAPGQAQGQVLLSFDQVEAVWVAWVKALAPARGLPENDPTVMLAAGQRTKKQVGPLNHANWLEAGGGTMWLGPVTSRAMTPQERKEAGLDKPEPDLSPQGMYDRLCGTAQRYTQGANTINAAVVQVEHQTHKLKSPEGAKGIAYQIAAGGMGLMYGVGAKGVHYAKEKGNLAGQAVNKALGVDEPMPSVSEKAAELEETAGTSVDVLTGKLHELWKQTRPTYNAYQSAYKQFDQARSAFYAKDYLDLAGLSAALDAMRAALKAMAAAAKGYAATCQALGVPEQAVKVDKLGQAIVDGMTKAVEVAVDMLGGVTAGPEDMVDKGLKGALVDVAKDRTIGDATGELPKALAKRAAK